MAYRSTYPLPTLKVPRGLGVNIHFIDWNLQEIAKIAEAGIKWVRIDLIWSFTEREKGVYNFRPYDKLKAECDKHGIRLMFILSYNNPLYLTDEQRKHREANGIEDYNYGIDTPEATDAFIRWVKAAIAHFKGQGVLWELWNEPNRNHFWRPVASPDAYIELAVKVGAAIRSTARSEYFVGPGCNINPNDLYTWEYATRIIQSPALKYFDAITIHPYRLMPPESAVEDYQKLRAMIDESRLKQGITRRVHLYCGEWGYTLTDIYPDMSDYKVGSSPNLLPTQDITSTQWSGYWQKPVITVVGAITDPIVSDPDASDPATTKETATAVPAVDADVATGATEVKIQSETLPFTTPVYELAGTDRNADPGRNWSGVWYRTTTPLSGWHVVSCWLRSTGAPFKMLLGTDDSSPYQELYVTSEWRLYKVLIQTSGSANRPGLFTIREGTANNPAWQISDPRVEKIEIDEETVWKLKQKAQAKAVLDIYRSNLRGGVPLTIWFNWQDVGQDRAEIEHNFGLVDFHGKPKLGQHAVKALVDTLRDWKPFA